ncbi:glycosyltransferase [Erythrobacter sp. sf7]|uniref:Glycosyltransferase n=2 Tax=Erythrobacter fulvus TaxID=2987523 RepID=A0ABT5JNT4_9SPHN|nr:glycosyltransferase [Erythrobacter fulvus]
MPTFEYYYNDVMPLPDAHVDTTFPRTHEQKTTAAKKDLARLLKQLEVGGDDTICYPSVDFYSLLALVELIDELRAAGSPKLLIRLIGVMETASSGRYSKPLNVTIALINRLFEAGLPVRLAAETPRYAEYLAGQLNRPVAVAANIEIREQVPLPQTEQFTVICPGSARYDKGFLDLAELFSGVRRRDPDMRIRFITQVLPDRDLKHQIDYLVRLYAIPGTTLLPSQLSPVDLAKLYEEADLVLLPYAQDVYQFRGSAVLIEAMMSGRHCLALEGPAFVDQMRYFGSGTACRSIADMADKVIACSMETPLSRHAKASQARGRFVRDLVSSYRDWVI